MPIGSSRRGDVTTIYTLRVADGGSEDAGAFMSDGTTRPDDESRESTPAPAPPPWESTPFWISDTTGPSEPAVPPGPPAETLISQQTWQPYQPQYPAPQYAAPQYPAPQYPAPQYPAPQYPTPAPSPPGYHPQPVRARRWGKIGGGAAAGAGAAAKTGLLAKLLLALKGAAFLGKLKFGLTMAASVVAYTWLYGWRFAVGLVALLAVHEFGHMAAFRMQGVKASLPMFVPFLGAYVKAESPVRSVGNLAASALAGPLAGAIAGLACVDLSHDLHSPLLQALGYTSFFINFINLMPLWILDGAKVAQVLHPGLFLGALGVGLVVELSRPSRITVFLVILGVVALFERWHNRARYDAAYKATPSNMRAWISVGYIGVALMCLWGMNIAYIPR